MLIALITLWVIVVIAITFFMHACKKLNEQFDNDSWENSVRHDIMNDRINKLELPNLPNRTKVSLRNPLRTFEAHYDNYKGRESNLYEPVKPKRKAGRNEVDVNDV